VQAQALGLAGAEERATGGNDNGMDDERELIDEVVLEQGLAERSVAVSDKAAALAGLELANRLDRIPADNARVSQSACSSVEENTYLGISRSLPMYGPSPFGQLGTK
jgi:hypothetical protein